MSDLRTILERGVGGATPPPDGFERLLRRSDRKRRNQRIAAAVVGIAVFVGGVWFVTSGGSPDRTQTPAVPGGTTEPSTGPRSVYPMVDYRLPPEGTEPSTPETGELVATLDARPGDRFPASFVPVHQVWVYADGRVIWRREGGPFGGGPEGTDGITTGYLEQRLSPEGVQLLLSRLLSTGLFDRDRYVKSERGLSWGEIQVRNADRLVSLIWCCPDLNPPWTPGWDRALTTDPTPQQARDLIRISEGLADPASWLPASARQDVETRSYAPSRYAICYERELFGTEVSEFGNPSLELSRVVGVLPSRARDLLLAADENVSPVWLSDLAENPTEHAPCSEIKTEDARALEEILIGAGLGRVAGYLALSYRAEAPEPIGRFFIQFEPILPHGQWSAMGG